MNVRSLNSSERSEEVTQEVDWCRWDALLIRETLRSKKAEIWETRQGHIFMGAGKIENKHVVGMLVNKKWRKRIIWTDYINERAIATSITVNILLMSVYFSHSGSSDHHVERAYRSIEKLTKSKRRAYKLWEEISTLSWGPGSVSEIG